MCVAFMPSIDRFFIAVRLRQGLFSGAKERLLQLGACCCAVFPLTKSALFWDMKKMPPPRNAHFVSFLIFFKFLFFDACYGRYEKPHFFFFLRLFPLNLGA